MSAYALKLHAMDSLTQIALGSAVSVAVMGRKTALWKAALWGAIAGTLPDLDALIDHGDAVLNMTRHRAETHSLFYLTLAAPLLAWVVARLNGERTLFKSWWLAIWLVLITHPLLDTMTVYGTQLLMPFSDYPFQIGSIFIIDPLYTLPLIVGVVLAVRLKDDRGIHYNATGLIFSAVYLMWSFAAQQHATGIARTSLVSKGMGDAALLVTPAPFNTLLWRVLAVTPKQYFEGHYSLLDPTRNIIWTSHDRGEPLISQYDQDVSVVRMKAFTHGFYSLSKIGSDVFVTDLRMGQEPAYTFRFKLGQPKTLGDTGPQLMSQRPNLDTALPWLWQRMWGEVVASPR